MDITTKNAEFQEKSMVFLDYLLRIQKAYDVFNIGLNSLIYVYMSGKNQKNIFFYIFSTNKLAYYYYIFNLICMFYYPMNKTKRTRTHNERPMPKCSLMGPESRMLWLQTYSDVQIAIIWS